MCKSSLGEIVLFDLSGKPRYLKEESGGTLRLIIPSKKNWPIVLFLTFWLFGWLLAVASTLVIIARGCWNYLSEGSFGYEILESGSDVLLITLILAGLIVCGLYTIHAWLWMIRGVEIVTITCDNLNIDKSIPFMTRFKQYPLSEVSDLRMCPTGKFRIGYKNDPSFGLGGGRLVFNYNKETVRFGIGVYETEKKLILEDIKERFPEIMEQ